MPIVLNSTLNQLNHIRHKSFVVHMAIKFLRAVTLAVFVFCLWCVIRPEYQNEQLILGVLTFVLIVWFGFERKRRDLSKEEILLYMNKWVLLMASSLK
jgi:multisubunit Na+/H+ antiporter MnhE subunit